MGSPILAFVYLFVNVNGIDPHQVCYTLNDIGYHKTPENATCFRSEDENKPDHQRNANQVYMFLTSYYFLFNVHSNTDIYFELTLGHTTYTSTRSALSSTTKNLDTR